LESAGEGDLKNKSVPFFFLNNNGLIGKKIIQKEF
jgi:hypothetical protein